MDMVGPNCTLCPSVSSGIWLAHGYFDEYEHEMADADHRPQRIGMALLLCFHVVLCCVSLVYVSKYHDAFHIFYDPARLCIAVIPIAAFALVSYLFTRVDFSFGYFIGFYFYTMVLGY